MNHSVAGPLDFFLLFNNARTRRASRVPYRGADLGVTVGCTVGEMLGWGGRGVWCLLDWWFGESFVRCPLPAVKTSRSGWCLWYGGDARGIHQISSEVVRHRIGFFGRQPLIADGPDSYSLLAVPWPLMRSLAVAGTSSHPFTMPIRLAIVAPQEYTSEATFHGGIAGNREDLVTMAQIQLGRHQFRQIGVIRDLDIADLEAVAQRLSGLKPLRPTDLLEAVKDALGGNESAAEALTRQCLSFNGLMRNASIESDELVSAVNEAIERESEWTPAELEKWKSIEPAVRELINADAFRIVAKSIDLSYEYANLYRRGRILTDIRPLFTTAADSIEGAVVSFTLRLRYESVDGDHALSIALDEDDVRELAAQCKRALTKARTAQELMSSKAEIPTIVTGERDDA